MGVAGIGEGFPAECSGDRRFLKRIIPLEGVATNVVGAQGKTFPSQKKDVPEIDVGNLWVVRDPSSERREDFPLTILNLLFQSL